MKPFVKSFTSDTENGLATQVQKLIIANMSEKILDTSSITVSTGGTATLVARERADNVRNIHRSG